MESSSTASGSRPPFWKVFLDGEPEYGNSHTPSARVFDPNVVFWAMHHLPVTEAIKHFLICGTVGSGKTKTIQLFLQSIAPRFRRKFDAAEQLVIFDAKGDSIPRLEKMGLSPDHENVWILNPFDGRAASWDLGEAIQSPAMARYLATLFVADEPNSTAPYFPNTARQIVFWVALSLWYVRRHRGWSLRDLLNALDSREHIKAVTSRLPRARKVLKQHLEDKRHFPGVLSTLATKVGRFEEVAALWATSKSKRKFSIGKFLSEGGVLILGHDPVLQESIWPMNAIILQALTNEILREGETSMPRHWFVLDEFRAMGEVRCIRDLLNLGRSKGASVLLGIQSIEGLTEIYRDHAANEILSLCSTKTFLRAGGPATAEWAERHFNKVRYLEHPESETFGKDYSRSVQSNVQERSLFLASTFLNLPLPEAGGRFCAISDIPCLQTTRVTERPFDEILALCDEPSPKELKAETRFSRTDVEEQIMRPWDANEETDFCDTLESEPGVDDAAEGEKPAHEIKEKDVSAKLGRQSVGKDKMITRKEADSRRRKKANDQNANDEPDDYFQ